MLRRDNGLHFCAWWPRQVKTAEGQLQAAIESPRLTATESCDVRWGRIRIFLDRLQVLLNRFERGSRHPAKQSCDDEILVRVHLNVVALRVAGHRGAGRGNAGLSLHADSSRMTVGVVHAPLLPAHGDQAAT